MPRGGCDGTALRRVAVGALVTGGFAAALSAGPALAAGTSGHSSGPPASAQGLIARLAVLRRPQTSQDVLPASPAVHAPPFNGVIIPSLTRLVSSSSSLQVYLVVTTPARGAQRIWSPRLGDQVALVSETSQAAYEGEAVPAADLSDGLDVQPVGGGDGSPPQESAAIIPDGVARVRWTFDAVPRGRGPVVDVPVSGNFAAYPFSRSAAFVVRARWFAADGSAVPTSDAALRQAIAQREARRRAVDLRYDRSHPTHVARFILDHFAVFAIHSRTGVRLSDGVVVSWPRLTALPLNLLEIARGFGRGPTVDLTDTRQVTTPRGVRFWVAAGPHTACVFTVDPPSGPHGFGGGAGGACGSVSSTGTYGLGVSFGSPNGRNVSIRVLPITHPTLSVRTAHGRRTIRPVDGIYVTVRPTRRHPGTASAGA